MAEDSNKSSELIKIPERLLSINGNLNSVLYAAACDATQTGCGECAQICSSQGCGTQCGPQCSQGCTIREVCTSQCNQGCSEVCSQGCSQGCDQSTPSVPKAGTISIVKSMTTATSITVKIAAISGATSYHIVWRRSSASTVIGERTVSSAGNVTISGLDPNTSYTFNYYGINSAGTGEYATGVSETTLSGRPDDWVWSTSFYSGKRLPVRSDKTYVILPASEWTDFQDRINEFRSYTNMPLFGFNSVSRGTKFEAYNWNQSVWAICAMTGTNDSIYEVNSVDKIYAHMFQDLADELNSIP